MARIGNFHVTGPHKIAVHRNPGGRIINESKIQTFWNLCGVKRGVGCYVFGLQRKGGSIKPWYIGRATKSFEQEVFNSRNLLSFNKVLTFGTGRPFLSFVVLDRKKGPVNTSAITQLEGFLIEFAFKANPQLMNKHGRPRLFFTIRGVLPARQGEARASSALKFRRMMQL